MPKRGNQNSKETDPLPALAQAVYSLKMCAMANDSATHACAAWLQTHDSNPRTATGHAAAILAHARAFLATFARDVAVVFTGSGAAATAARVADLERDEGLKLRLSRTIDVDSFRARYAAIRAYGTRPVEYLARLRAAEEAVVKEQAMVAQMHALAALLESTQRDVLEMQPFLAQLLAIEETAPRKRTKNI